MLNRTFLSALKEAGHSSEEVAKCFVTWVITCDIILKFVANMSVVCRRAIFLNCISVIAKLNHTLRLY